MPGESLFGKNFGMLRIKPRAAECEARSLPLRYVGLGSKRQYYLRGKISTSVEINSTKRNFPSIVKLTPGRTLHKIELCPSSNGYRGCLWWHLAESYYIALQVFVWALGLPKIPNEPRWPKTYLFNKVSSGL